MGPPIHGFRRPDWKNEVDVAFADRADHRWVSFAGSGVAVGRDDPPRPCPACFLVAPASIGQPSARADPPRLRGCALPLGGGEARHARRPGLAEVAAGRLGMARVDPLLRNRPILQPIVGAVRPVLPCELDRNSILLGCDSSLT